ncbi:hypothetical protein [Intrasporangium sp.]|uniref:hypothetical protein n=1 Tax=Intrasporangium sp. TaxID=1925024 RepID=UPI003221A619
MSKPLAQRVVAAASAVIFALVVLMAHLLVGMHDRSSPIALGSPPRLMLDFSQSSAQGDAALLELRRLDAQAGLGLAKLGANLSGDLRGVVLIPVNESALTGESVARYEDAPTHVVGLGAWRYTTVNGGYLATGDQQQLQSAVERLQAMGVRVTRSDTSVDDGISSLVRVKGMLLAFVTACVLLVTLVLYWLAAKARRRALNVLAGSSVTRIQLHDLGQLLGLVVGVWVPVALVAAALIGAVKSWDFLPVFGQYVSLLAAFVLLVTVGAAVAMSVVSIPSPSLIARRRPATLGVRRAAIVLKGGVFLLVMVLVGPAGAALAEASTRAEQLARWEALADYAAVVFPDAMEADMQRIRKPFGQMVREAERDGQRLLFSETFLPPDGTPAQELDQQPFHRVLAGRWQGISLVNQAWLDIGVGPDRAHLMAVKPGGLPPQLTSELRSWFDQLWGAPGASSEQIVAGLRYLAPTGGEVPVVYEGDLVYRSDVLLVVVPDVAATLRDDALLNASTGRSLLFEGVEETQRHVDAAGLGKDVKVQYAADDGVLAAQVASYEAWLGVASMVGLAVALIIAAMISAYVEMLLQARNDFARRLSGQAWLRVIGRRVVPEIVFGAVIGLAVLLTQPKAQQPTVALTLLVLLAASPAAHVMAGRRGFADVTARRL